MIVKKLLNYGYSNYMHIKCLPPLGCVPDIQIWCNVKVCGKDIFSRYYYKITLRFGIHLCKAIFCEDYLKVSNAIKCSNNDPSKPNLVRNLIASKSKTVSTVVVHWYETYCMCTPRCK